MKLIENIQSFSLIREFKTKVWLEKTLETYYTLKGILRTMGAYIKYVGGVEEGVGCRVVQIFQKKNS